MPVLQDRVSYIIGKNGFDDIDEAKTLRFGAVRAPRRRG